MTALYKRVLRFGDDTKVDLSKRGNAPYLYEKRPKPQELYSLPECGHEYVYRGLGA